MRRREFLQTAGAATALTVLGGCLGDDEEGEFPDDTMHFLTGHSTGGGFDLEIRTFADHVADYWDINTTVENMTGAGGQVMYEHFWENVEPDGYTIAQLNAQNSATQYVLDDVPYEAGGWTYLGQKSQSIRSIIVRTGLGLDTWDDLVDATRNDELLWATTDIAGGGTLIGAYIGEISGVWDPANVLDNAVVLDGTGDVPVLMGSEDVDVLAVSHGTALRFARDNDHIELLIACTAGDPPEDSPDLPTLGTEGVPNASDIEDAVSQRRMLIAPPGMEDEHPDRVDILMDGFGDILTSDDFIQDLVDADRSPAYLSPEDAAQAHINLQTFHEAGVEIFEGY